MEEFKKNLEERIQQLYQSLKTEVEKEDKLKFWFYRTFGNNGENFGYYTDGKISLPEASIFGQTLGSEAYELNYLSRLLNYVNAMSMTGTALEAAKAQDIIKYENIGKRFNIAISNPGKKITMATATVNDVTRMNSNGLLHGDFDELYATIDGCCSNLEQKKVDILPSRIPETIGEQVEKLHNMSPEEYRQYKIGLLQLSENEKSRIARDTAQLEFSGTIRI